MNADHKKSYGDAMLSDEALIRAIVAPVFDTKFYCQRYPDVAANDDDALDHYIASGWREGRWPNAKFDSSFYLAANPDVRTEGLNAFAHFLLRGAYEGRKFHPLIVRPARHAVASAKSPREQSRNAEALVDLANLSYANLDTKLQAAKGMIISLSHDQYWRIGGGVQNAVADEQRIAASLGWNYLHLCPVWQLPMLADTTRAELFRVAVTLNGKSLGLTAFADVIAIARGEAAKFGEVKCVIHQLLGHVPELVEELILACRTPSPFVWIHDHFTLCPSFAMQRNNVADCGGPPIKSPACQICNSGIERPDHFARMSRLFSTTRPVVLSPSSTFLNFWQTHTTMNYTRGMVVPYCRVEFDPDVPAAGTVSKIRVGFLGAPTYRKGWDTFATLAKRHTGDSRYEFLQLGWADPHSTNVTHVYVKVSPDDRHAMVNAIVAAEIDVAVNWSLFYESFSFATIEAIAGGAFIITRRGAGNIWPLVSGINAQRGYATDSEFELQTLFASGQVLHLMSNADRRRGKLIIGSAIAQVLFGQGIEQE
jgi:hypothetical protein